MFGHESKLKVKEIFVYYAEQEIAIEKLRQILDIYILIVSPMQWFENMKKQVLSVLFTTIERSVISFVLISICGFKLLTFPVPAPCDYINIQFCVSPLTL